MVLVIKVITKHLLGAQPSAECLIFIISFNPQNMLMIQEIIKSFVNEETLHGNK